MQTVARARDLHIGTLCDSLLRSTSGTASSIWGWVDVSSGTAYTALMRQLQHDRAQEWAHMRLTTIGEACR